VSTPTPTTVIRGVGFANTTNKGSQGQRAKRALTHTGIDEEYHKNRQWGQGQRAKRALTPLVRARSARIFARVVNIQYPLSEAKG
jgi:hypothetical protein